MDIDPNFPKEYLGDGAYVAFSGYSFIIYTSDGYRIQNEVHLEAHELCALNLFVKRMEQEYGYKVPGS